MFSKKLNFKFKFIYFKLFGNYLKASYRIYKLSKLFPK